MAIYARLENGTYAEVTGVYKTDGTEITEIFQGDRLVYSASNEIYGALPLYYNGKGYDLTDYLISGNAVQDGTPSTDAPVDAVGCGVRTENLFDGAAAYGVMYRGGVITGQAADINNIKNKVTADMIGKTYTISITPLQIVSRAYISIIINGTAYWRENVLTVNQKSSFKFTPVTENDQWYITYDVGGVCSYKDIMVNEGPTAPTSYIPYGYKLPILSNSTVTNIYLGEAEATRRIKKLVLSGEENITSSHTDIGLYKIPVTDYLKIVATTTNVCSHYKASINVNGWFDITDMSCCFYGNTSSPSKLLYIRDTSYTSIADFKAYLAQQYAAGTPVTVWYVLAKPETAVVNEPLMKIGDYADTISFAQSQVTIPTVSGANVLDMASPVKPSEMYIKGKGIKQNRGQS